MISNELLLRNKKMADYSIEVAKNLGITNEYDRNKIYSFILMFNKSFEEIDFKDENEVKKAINKVKEYFKTIYKNSEYDFFSIYKKNDYMKRIFDILYLTILQIDSNGELVSMNKKMDELKEIFGENSRIYELFVNIYNEYNIKDKKNMNFILSFINTGIVSDETKGIVVKCNADINDEYIKRFILNIFSTTSFKYVNDLEREIKIFLYTYNIKCDKLEIKEMEDIDYYNYSMNHEYNSEYDLEFIYNISYDDNKEKLLFSYLMQTSEFCKVFNIIRNKINNKWEYNGKYFETQNNNSTEIEFGHDFCSRYSFEYTFPIIAETFLKSGGMIRLHRRTQNNESKG